VARDHWYLPCLCGYAAPTVNLAKKHRAFCLAWLARDQAAIKRERSQASFRKNGHQVHVPCESCGGRPDHRKGCPRIPPVDRPVPAGISPEVWMVILRVLERKMRGKYQG